MADGAIPRQYSRQIAHTTGKHGGQPFCGTPSLPQRTGWIASSPKTATGIGLHSGSAAEGIGASARGCSRAHVLLKKWKRVDRGVLARGRVHRDRGRMARHGGIGVSCVLPSSFDGSWIAHSPSVFDVDFSPSSRGVTYAYFLCCKDQDLTTYGDSPVCPPRDRCSAGFSAEFDV